MTGRIVFTNKEHTLGRIEHENGVVFGPIPPNCGEARAVYERLIEQGVKVETYQNIGEN